MKNSILFKAKSIQGCSCVLSYFSIPFLALSYGTKIFYKRFVYVGMILFLGLSFSQNTYGQLVGGAAVKANFGVEGDAYANLLQFGSLSNQNGTDDWFQQTYPGPGFGVIDQSLPFPLLNNTPFSRRQSITSTTPGYVSINGYPVVRSGLGADQADFLWLDAVYGRDTYVKGGNSETSYFAGSGDKNSDNPSTWSIGTSGSVPQKTDIVDVFAHLRGEGIRTPDGNNPRPYTTLWAYAGATIVVTDGNKHIDFEFFRTELDEVSDLLVPNSTGLDGGRTAWTFNADGSVNVPGTLIVSVDYTNGGTVPQVRIRVWMDETVFNNYDNTKPLRPFTTSPGTFEKGEGSGNFGYGVILSNVGTTNIWGRVNNNASTLGPPWGTFTGSGPDPVTDFQALQFVEVGINLTAFGLDKGGTQGPCSNLLGSLLVKTRSSGGGPTEGAFGSELKDFAGPYLFGTTITPTVSATVNRVIDCVNQDATITATNVSPQGAEIKWYDPSMVLIPGDNPQDPDRVVTLPGTYTVKAFVPGNSSCFAESTVVVE
ncbi:hypothetical protein ACSVH5_07890, partial [Flavobacterium sp. RSSA_27]|uniref:hypothetical protein n=1 Tax=Flavobacterium sp. RSSA_27 TaxID=3447667 RepID=UPI003F3F4A1B